jgi:peptide/nickel transport system permease protein
VSRRYLVRRLIQVVPTVVGILLLTFVLAHLTGDPVQGLAGEGADRAQMDALRTQLGLNRPLPRQFAVYADHVLHGNLGTSFAQHQSVASLIRQRLPATLLLTGSALLLSIVGGLVLGILAARRPNGALDVAVSSTSLIVYAMPAFWLAQLAVLTLALKAGLFPTGAMTDARVAHTGLSATVDIGRHLVLPALVLALSEVALLLRVTRSGLVEELGNDYVAAARAKGVPENVLLKHHALPNALLPVVTVIGSRVGFLVSGAVLVESVFGWPGLGRLLVDAAQSGDHPVILGMVLLISFSVVLANLLTDLAYAWIDPRISRP